MSTTTTETTTTTTTAPNWKRIAWTGAAFVLAYLLLVRWFPPIAQPWLSILILGAVVWALSVLLPANITKWMIPAIITLWFIWCITASVFILIQRNSLTQRSYGRWEADKALSAAVAMDPRLLEARAVIFQRLQGSETEYAKHLLIRLKQLDENYASGKQCTEWKESPSGPQCSKQKDFSYEDLVAGYQDAARRLDAFRETNEKLVQVARGDSWRTRLTERMSSWNIPSLPKFELTLNTIMAFLLVIFTVAMLFVLFTWVRQQMRDSSSGGGGHHG